MKRNQKDKLNFIPDFLFQTVQEQEFRNLSPRSKEISTVITEIRHSFRDTNKPPETKPEFFKLGRMLGKGAFGKVHLGMHKVARKLIAVKTITKEFLNDEKQRRKLMKEVTILKRLRHKNVVKLYETFESDKFLFFAMELCAGGDLLGYV